MSLDPWFKENLVCPIDHSDLSEKDGFLLSESGNRYPIIENIPIMLCKNRKHTLHVAEKTLLSTQKKDNTIDESNLYIETLGIDEDQKQTIRNLINKTKIDPVVSVIVGATNGIAYKHLIGKLDSYPIPKTDFLPSSPTQDLFLDIGCNWGRWSLSASKKGFKCVGLDPSLGAVLAAKRVASQLGLNPIFIVGDSRYLPFKSNSFDTVFSYSVLQHMSYEDLQTSIDEISRVLAINGQSIIQLPNKTGLLALYHQSKRGFKKAKDFEVRYWSLEFIKRDFENKIGKTDTFVDCFFGLGMQSSDIELMPLNYKIIITLSEALKRVSNKIKPLTYFADSIFFKSIKKGSL